MLCRAISRVLVWAFALFSIMGPGDHRPVKAFSLRGTSSLQQNSGPLIVTVTGVVKDDHGGTLPKASILFRQNKRIVKRVKSDEAGTFRIDLPVGIYSVVAKADGCHDFQQKKVKVAPSSNVPLLSMTLKCSPTPILE
jgi:Carboxypeptidase regulatory-like domain